MGAFSIWHILVLGIVVILLFGKGRFSGMMSDVAKGLKEFKKGMSEDDVEPKAPPQRIDGPLPTVIDAETTSEKQK